MTRQFTDEEIKNCRKIAEKGERKTVEYGDWCYSEIYWPGHGDRDKIDPKRVGLWRSHLPADENTAHTPLWQEHDCLEWLRKEYVPLIITTRDDAYAQKSGWRWQVVWGNPHAIDEKPWDGCFNAPTLLEALLRAVLAILEEK